VFDKATGKIDWEWKRGYLSFGFPELTSDQMYFGIQKINNRLNLIAFNVATRHVSWEINAEATYFEKPIYSSGSLFFGISNGIMCVDAASGESKWERKFENEKLDTAILAANNNLYFATSRRKFYALCAKDGTEILHIPLAWSASDPI